jgi:hypothetical protein
MQDPYIDKQETIHYFEGWRKVAAAAGLTVGTLGLLGMSAYLTYRIFSGNKSISKPDRQTKGNNFQPDAEPLSTSGALFQNGFHSVTKTRLTVSDGQTSPDVCLLEVGPNGARILMNKPTDQWGKSCDEVRPALYQKLQSQGVILPTEVIVRALRRQAE